jgi:hypothetical protein
MRLTTDQIQAIRDAASSTFGDQAAVWLFGSRVDDAKKGVTLTFWCARHRRRTMSPLPEKSAC